MGLETRGVAGNTLGKKSVAFGTAITRVVPARTRMITRISKMAATAAGTAHTLTVLRALGRTTTTAAGAADQAVINVAAINGTLSPTGNNLAANDLLVIRETDGVQRLYVVSSISSLAITLTGNLTAGVASGADIWNFGVVADTDPATGEAHQGFTVAASATTTYSDTIGGVAASNGHDEPLVLSDNNATATGTIEQVSYSYTPS